MYSYGTIDAQTQSGHPHELTIITLALKEVYFGQVKGQSFVVVNWPPLFDFFLGGLRIWQVFEM
jgi:hypothetical protein